MSNTEQLLTQILKENFSSGEYIGMGVYMTHYIPSKALIELCNGLGIAIPNVPSTDSDGLKHNSLGSHNHSIPNSI